MQVVPGSRLEVFDSEQPNAKNAQTKMRFMERRACPEPVEWAPSACGYCATKPASLPDGHSGGALYKNNVAAEWRDSAAISLHPSTAAL
jgi:hypothetical protein